MSRPKNIDWTNIVDDYVKLGTLSKVAAKYGCNIPTVSYHLKKIGYKPNHDNKGLNSTSGLGRYGEKIALILLQGSRDLNKTKNSNARSDLAWNGMLINVKTSRLNPSISRGKRFENMKWEYKIFNPSYTSDERKHSTHYLFIGLDENDDVEKVFLVPSSVLFKKCCIGRKSSKYDKYSRNDLLESTQEEIHALKLRMRIDFQVEGVKPHVQVENRNERTTA